MFTGIVTAIGTIREVRTGGDLRVVIACPYDPEQIAIGASIACSGVCLTVVERALRQAPDGTEEAWFAVDVSGETVSCTAQDQWRAGRRLNLEQALKLGDELGGHIVTGHVDGVGRVVSRETVGGSIQLVLLCPADLAAFIAPKGSVTVDGVSLTVNTVEDLPGDVTHFMLNIIPHTAEATTLGQLQAGDSVNLEIDVLARYLMRMQSLRS
jgi:riboflavin synthase